MLMNDFRKKCYEVQDYWGARMPMMVIEEAGELIQAISKYERKMSEENLQNLIDEVGDMYISLMALTLQNMDVNDDFEDRVEKRIEEKLNKKY